MSFDDLPPLPPPVDPAAKGYFERISELSRAVQRNARSALDLPYGADYWQKVDVYLPADSQARGLPVLCFMHGGAWVSGSKEWMGFMAPSFTDLPAIFISVNYRLSPAVRFPAAMDDCFDALAWIHRNIARFGGDPERIFVGGHSAGGHLAALLALRRELAAARRLPRDVVKACFPVSGLFDLSETVLVPGSWEERIYPQFLARLEDGKAASPIAYVEGNVTPFYLTWGTSDLAPVIPQSKAMVAALERQPGRLVFEEWQNYDHFAMSEDAQHRDSKWVGRVRRWIGGAFD
jgi:acetyl esterase/lipase